MSHLTAKAIAAVALAILLMAAATVYYLLVAFPSPDDFDREVWWTTTTCPAGVVTPCLDPYVSVHDLPEWARP